MPGRDASSLIQVWCSRAFACRADEGTQIEGDLGSSAAECAAKSDLPFANALYDRLGGQASAMTLSESSSSRFQDCAWAVEHASCVSVADFEQLFGADGYCDQDIEGQQSGFAEQGLV